MKAFVLLVTWIVPGQPPDSYQTVFSSAETCEAARDAVLADGRRLKAEFELRIIEGAKSIGWPPAYFLMGKQAPMVTAVCAAQ